MEIDPEEVAYDYFEKFLSVQRTYTKFCVKNCGALKLDGEIGDEEKECLGN